MRHGTAGHDGAGPGTARLSPDDPRDPPIDDPFDDDLQDLPPTPPSPTPPMPKIPPRPLDWPPGEGVDLPRTG